MANIQDHTPYFTPTYESSRSQFLAYAKRAIETRSNFVSQEEKKANCLSEYTVPSRSNQNDLTVNSVYLGATRARRNLVVVVSDSHGVEGFVGSAVQSLLLNELYSAEVNQDIGFLFVHSLNPYGFRFLRRATENNVNLNRNFSLSDEMYQQENKSYSLLSDWLTSMRKPFGLGCERLMAGASICKYLLFSKFSVDSLTRTLAGGQYRYPRGLEFGGHRPEPQTQHLIEMLRKILPEYEKAFVFDLHSGLGHPGEMLAIGLSSPISRDPVLLKEVLASSPLDRIADKSQAGFYQTTGDLAHVLPELVNSTSTKLLSLTIEYGTVGNGIAARLKLLGLLIAENLGALNGYRSEKDRARIAREFREAFCPSSLIWQATVLDKSRRFFSHVMKKISDLK